MSEELVDTALLAPSIMAETEWHVENGANIAVLTPYTYFLTLSFDGGNYRGWQRQADASSVQQALEEKLTMIFKKFTCAHGCGRTDAGVHASFYVAHIQLQEPLSFDLKFRLNKHLPKEIVIFDVTSVDHMRHARFDASSRTYNYYLHLYPDPALHRHRDFRAVCKQPQAHDSTVCSVFATQLLTDVSRQRMKFTISANRFLRGMVRLLVAYLLKIGTGEMSVQELDDTLAAQVPRQGIVPAHPNGLYLANVEYPFLEQHKHAHFTDILDAGLGV
eukprot:m.684767 g.684767  ORF g.684767 m.684767 type:complete len:275 (+) comp22834_c0_seq19:165-989(+)